MQGTLSLEDTISLLADSFKETAEKDTVDGAKQIILPLRVMCRLEDPLEMKTALFYYLYKNGKITLAGLLRQGAPKESVRAIEILESSKPENARDYALKVATSPLAVAVKKAELRELLSEGDETQGTFCEDEEKSRELLEYLCRVSASEQDGLHGFVRDPHTKILCHIKALEEENYGTKDKEKDKDKEPEDKGFPDENDEDEQD